MLVKTYAGHGYEVRDAAVCRDNSKFASVGGDKPVFLWDVASGAFIRKLRGHDGTINAVRWAAEDQVLLTAGYDQCVKVRRGGEEVQRWWCLCAAWGMGDEVQRAGTHHA